ncbi:hypothetical protein [Gluconobacter frateurii]|uniref:hypothetical protein n=1 Tax=Gluconobacter frateurii TaxID=38308 RepID=UPI003570DF61
MLCPGIQELIQDATRSRFTIVLAEAMDRFSHDQEDITGLFKRMTFSGAQIPRETPHICISGSRAP